MKHIKFLSTIILGILLLSGISLAQTSSREYEERGKLSKPAGEGVDIGYGLTDKGELINCYMNMGQITDSYLQTPIYNFMWPKSKGAITVGDNTSDDFSFIFARRGNVVDGYTAYKQEDWAPVKGSLGKYHAKDQADELKFEGYPRLAHSDLPATWPEGYVDEVGEFVSTPGERHWPGPFRIDINPDSPTYGQEVEGQFAADRVIYSILDDHDNLQGQPMGVQVEVVIYDYGRPYAADFEFYDFIITNTSNVTLDSSWWGFYIDLDYGDYTEEGYVTYSNGMSPGPWDVIYQTDPNGTNPGEFETGVFGIGFLKTPKDIGITDSHYFLDMGPENDRELWPIIISNPNDPNLPPPSTDYFHGTDVHLDDYSLTWNPPYQDWACYVMSGPFDLAPGESVKSTIVIAAGENPEDFQANIDMAYNMYKKSFQGPSGPDPPALWTVPGDGRVTLYWDNEPEITPDPFSGEYDFEGYKIYRSVDKGQTWGEKILDGSGGLVGWIPVAQFDLDNEVSGLDPLNANNFLGNNTGIQHTWVDSTVKNGVIYSYTITAYDRGEPENNIPSFESTMGTSPTDKHFITVTPESRPTGYVPPSAEKVEHISGKAKGEIFVEVIDPFSVTDHEYYILFTRFLADEFKIYDTVRGDTLISFPINTPDMPVIDGFRVQVNGDTKTGDVKSITDEYGRNVLGVGNSDTTDSWYVTYTPMPGASIEAQASDYEIRFTSNGSIACSWGKDPVASYQVPFEIWNTSEGIQINSELFDSDKDGQFDEGEEIFLINSPYTSPSLGDSVKVQFPDDFPYRILINNTASDTLKLPPLEGQIIKINTFRGFDKDDVYSFTITSASIDQEKIDLEQIRVVPNPYVVNARWETMLNIRRIRFMFLPPEAKISIYTTRGELVKVIHHNDGSGEEDWNLTSDSNQDLAFGLYIYVVEAPGKKPHIGKFALIK